MNELRVSCLFLSLLFLPSVVSAIRNPAIAILSESNIYLAQIKELNWKSDNLVQIYQHQDSVYPLQSLTANFNRQRIYFCSPTTIYSLDLHLEFVAVPLIPVDETPCRSSLTYLSDEDLLFWIYRRTLVQIEFDEMKKSFLWNSTSTISTIIANATTDVDVLAFYAGISLNSHQSSIVHCQADRFRQLYPLENCLFIDSGYQEVSALAIAENLLFVADRLQHRIFVLTLLPSGFVLRKETLPLNTSIVADIQSMIVVNNSLIWMTNSGHLRSVSLLNYEQIRTIFWFDEPLQSIRLVSFAQWPNRTTSTTSTTHSTKTSSSPSTTTNHNTTSSSDSSGTSTIITETNPWKATAYVTSIILGLALFLCAAMITCVLLNYRLGRVVPSSFTNIFHILRNRTEPTSNSSLTLSMEQS